MTTKEGQIVDVGAIHGPDDDLASLGSQDAMEMRNLGKRQQLKRNFGFWSILGFSCITMVTWEGELVTFLYGLENGGPTGLVIGFFVIWVGYGAVVVSLAEMMSAWPSSSGQYHWTYVMASPRWAAFLSYLCGWQTIIAWQAAYASSLYLNATIVQGLAILNNREYLPRLYQGTLIMWAMLVGTILINTLGAKLLPHLERFALALHVGGFIIVLVVVGMLSPSKATAHDVFDVFINSGGWPSRGVSLLVGIQGLVYAWVGADSAIHMSEEIQNASTAVPWALVGSIGINGTLGLAILLAVLYFGGNLNTALASPTGYPFIEIFTYATHSRAGGTGLTAIILTATSIGSISAAVATSRQLWSFSRDNAVPGSGFLKRVHRRSKLPLNSIFTSSFIVFLLSLINFGSAVAFNAIVSLTVAGFVLSYTIPLALMLSHRIKHLLGRESRPLPRGPWHLGAAGLPLNVVGLAWSVLITFWSFWPRTINPSPADMNWSVLAYGGMMLIALGFWAVDGRRRYKGPVRDAAGGEIDATLAELEERALQADESGRATLPE